LVRAATLSRSQLSIGDSHGKLAVEEELEISRRTEMKIEGVQRSKTELACEKKT
jgi:hypothetical protein